MKEREREKKLVFVNNKLIKLHHCEKANYIKTTYLLIYYEEGETKGYGFLVIIIIIFFV